MMLETENETETTEPGRNTTASFDVLEAGLADLVVPDSQVFVDESGRRRQVISVAAWSASLLLVVFILVGLVGVMRALGFAT